MSNVKQYELEGVQVYNLKKHPDERGYFSEVLRQDWKDFLGTDKIVQSGLSMSYPGIVRAWHQHTRGQVDYFLVIQGTVRIVIYDDQNGSPTRGKLVELIVSEEQLQLTRVPGYYWHGTKSVGNKPSLTLYFFTRLYDYTNPDEERLLPDSATIVDYRTGRPYDWDSAICSRSKEA